MPASSPDSAATMPPIGGEGSDGEEEFSSTRRNPRDNHRRRRSPRPQRHDDDEDGRDGMGYAEDEDDYIFQGHKDEVFTVACSPTDASLVASGGKDDIGFLWRIGSAAEGALEQLTGSEECNVWMWNADHNAILNTFPGHSSTVTCGDFTPDGKLVCTGSDDATLRIWDPRSAQSRHVVRGHGYHTDGLTCLSITLDSQILVSASKDNSMHIVNVNSGQIVGSLVGHTNSIECVGISSSYGWVATGSKSSSSGTSHINQADAFLNMEGVYITGMAGFIKVCCIRMPRWQGAHLGQPLRGLRQGVWSQSQQMAPPVCLTSPCSSEGN